jgi:hypothetical protein
MPGAASVQIAIGVLKQDTSVAPFDIEVDAVYLAPNPSQGWQ